MSRPPNQYNDAPSHIGNRYQQEQQTIDFKMGNPYVYDPSECQPASIYAQAGFPGYTQQAAGYNMPIQGYNQISSQAAYPKSQACVSQYQPQMISSSACLPAYPQQGYAAQPVASSAVYQQGYAPPSIASALPSQPLYSHASLESEAVVQERIKANIDAIMDSQKTAMLNSKLV